MYRQISIAMRLRREPCQMIALRPSSTGNGGDGGDDTKPSIKPNTSHDDKNINSKGLSETKRKDAKGKLASLLSSLESKPMRNKTSYSIPKLAKPTPPAAALQKGRKQLEKQFQGMDFSLVSALKSASAAVGGGVDTESELLKSLHNLDKSGSSPSPNVKDVLANMGVVRDDRAPQRRGTWSQREDNSYGRAPRGIYDEGNDRAPRGRYDKGNDRARRGRYDEGNDKAPRGRYDEGNDKAPRGRYDEGNDRAPRGRYNEGNDRAPRGGDRSVRPMQVVNLSGNRPLDIFPLEKQPVQSGTPPLPTWEAQTVRELSNTISQLPSNQFEETILWTKQGKVWTFPIDNEMGLDEEMQVGFGDHVFLEVHLAGWCPRTGPIRQFMELVCVGLSRNPHITVQRKVDNIAWYRDFFADKQEMLRTVGALTESVEGGEQAAA